MSELQNSLLRAMEAVAGYTTQHSNATITIKAEIIEVIDPVQGQYKAKYLERELVVYAPPAISYAVGSIVYILVPDGNFSERLQIVGYAVVTHAQSIRKGQEQKYQDLSQNLLSFSKPEEYNGLQLCSYSGEGDKTSSGIVNIDNLNHLLRNGRADTVCFKCDLETHLSQEQQAIQGDYGIALKFRFKQKGASDNTALEEVLEISTNAGTILGNPYALEMPLTQYIYYSFDGSVFEIVPDSAQISYYRKNFIPGEEGKSYDSDIYFKNISITACKILAQSTGYSLQVDTTGGRTYPKTNPTAAKQFSVELQYDGVPTEIKDSDFIQWFVQDETVTSGSPEYYAKAGAGWRSISPIDGDEVVQSVSRITVERPVGYQVDYKCVLTRENVNYSEEFTILNLNSEWKVSVVTKDGLYRYFKGEQPVIFNVEVTGPQANTNNYTYEYIWSHSNSSGQIAGILQSGETDTQQILPLSALDGSNTVKCSVKVNNQLVGTGEAVISVNTPEQFRVELSAPRVFKYDINGNSPFSAAYNGTFTENINPLTYTIFTPNGQPLATEDYDRWEPEWRIKKKSLISIDPDMVDEEQSAVGEYYVIPNVTELSYHIAARYNVKLADAGRVELVVTDGGHTLTAAVDLVFLKEGENGTNGTEYSAIIKPANDWDGKLVYSDLWKWRSSSNGALIPLTADNSPYFATQVFSGGLLVPTEDWSVTYTWYDAGFGSDIYDPILPLEKNGYIRPPEKSTAVNVIGVYIVQACVTVGGHDIYAYYPIEISYIVNSNEAAPTISGGFSEILYNSARKKPMVNGDMIFTSDSEVQWSVCGATPAILTLPTKNTVGKEINVSVRQDLSGDGNIKAYIQARALDEKGQPTGNFTVKPIVVLIDRYGNVNMNQWDGNKVKMGDDYLFAPQMAAGVKESDNTFTGVYMGKTSKRNGLIGQHKGADTFFLDAETGDFAFGNKQIQFNAEKKRLILQGVTLQWDAINSPDLDTATAAEYFKAYKTFQEEIQTQVDGKAETWYQSSDPALAWTTDKLKKQHKGDIWYDTTNKVTKVWNGAIWKDAKSIPPKEVYDRIDGKAAIYAPSSSSTMPSNPQANDLIIPVNSFGSYVKEKVYKYNGSSWVEIAYTDNSALDSFKTTLKKALGNETTEIGESYIISPKIGGGYLDISGGTSDNKSQVVINPKAGTIFSVKNKKGTEVIGFNTNGDATFTGAITATSLSLGSGVKVPYGSISGQPDLTVYIQKNGTVGTLPAGEADASGKTGFKVSTNGLLTASNAVIYGTVYASAGKIGGINLDASGLFYSGTNASDGFGLWKAGAHKHNNTAIIMHAGGNNSNIGGAKFRVYQNGNVVANSFTSSSATITGGSLKVGNNFSVSKEGVLSASGAKISGALEAGSGSDIGGWKVQYLNLQLPTWSNSDPLMTDFDGSALVSPKVYMGYERNVVIGDREFRFLDKFQTTYFTGKGLYCYCTYEQDDGGGNMTEIDSWWRMYSWDKLLDKLIRL